MQNIKALSNIILLRPSGSEVKGSHSEVDILETVAALSSEKQVVIKCWGFLG